jgi:hypothetical protein
VAGEGLAGVLVAALVALGVAPRAMAPRLSGTAGEAMTLLVLAGLAVVLSRAGSKSS